MIEKNNLIDYVNEKLNNANSISKVVNQINMFYEYKDNFKLPKHNYNIGDDVFLRKGTLLHGTYKNIDGLKEIVNNGLISSWFINGRLSKYPSSVGVWNLKQDYYLKDYIKFYSGSTIMYCGVYDNGIDTQTNKTDVISYDKLSNMYEVINRYECHMWTMEQTKEARFMPSLVQNRVQIGIIFNGKSNEIKNLLQGDILNPSIIDDNEVKEFVNPDYYEKFIKTRKNKDDFFTDRESAIIFGIPSCFIEGILIGRNYEKDDDILDKIKELLPNCYICNLNGKIIRE